MKMVVCYVSLIDLLIDFVLISLILMPGKQTFSN